MTWQLASFAILGLALAGGFGWYERTCPDARIIALVGTLAAFAALGRIAFAALPNVKPTTDIVLVSGYALGGAPGFVVGALAGLTSNFFFGQGPWTPWQMAAWGATGLLGAGLAVITARRVGRWPLAIACAVAGFAFTVLQDLGDWVNYSDHSLAQLGVYVGKGIGFDIVHATACLVFALAFGPALTRSIVRFATRLKITWRPLDGVAAPAIAVLIPLALASALTSPPQARASATPTQYLLAAQNSDGGFGPAPGSSSSDIFSGWAALGLAAEGRNPQTVSHGGRTLSDYMRGVVGSESDPGSLERTILAVRAAGLSATSFGGRDLVAALQRDLRRDGSVSDQVNLTAFAILALRAADAPLPSGTLAWLVRQQDSDGGFNFATAGASSDVDDTGAALQELAGADGSAAARARARAVGFIRAQQSPDGGFPSNPGADSNAQSTAWAVQGLLAAGVDPDSLHRGGVPSPLRYLSSLIGADGHVHYSRNSDQTPVWVTAQAAMALARKPLPLATVPLPAAEHRIRRRAHRAAPVAATSSSPNRAPARRVVEHAAPPPSYDWLAIDAGIATALALAPIGQG
jgi:energy-coupling factor transport system substrate-specific component